MKKIKIYGNGYTTKIIPETTYDYVICCHRTPENTPDDTTHVCSCDWGERGKTLEKQQALKLNFKICFGLAIETDNFSKKRNNDQLDHIERDNGIELCEMFYVPHTFTRQSGLFAMWYAIEILKGTEIHCIGMPDTECVCLRDNKIKMVENEWIKKHLNKFSFF